MATVLTADLAFDQIMVKHPQRGELILVHQDGAVHAYRNSCPHVGVGLDWGDGRCLVAPGELMCAMHGALFVAATGLCVAGPCAGKSLTRVAVQVEEGRVVCE